MAGTFGEQYLQLTVTLGQRNHYRSGAQGRLTAVLHGILGTLDNPFVVVKGRREAEGLYQPLTGERTHGAEAGR